MKKGLILAFSPFVLIVLTFSMFGVVNNIGLEGQTLTIANFTLYLIGFIGTLGFFTASPIGIYLVVRELIKKDNERIEKMQ